MIEWQMMAFWPPKKRAMGEMFLFFQPETMNGRVKLYARIVVDNAIPGSRTTTAWARAKWPPESLR